MGEETVNGRVERELQEAADEVVKEFADDVARTCSVKAIGNLKWEVNVNYTLPWGGLQPVTSLIIDDAYPLIPDREVLKARIRVHLLANPPKPKIATH